LENQSCIFPIDRQEYKKIGLNGVNNYADFEVIVILDDTDPYVALSGIDWEYYNDSMINLKQQHMLFEKGWL
jgi:hypothetical protein